MSNIGIAAPALFDPRERILPRHSWNPTQPDFVGNESSNLNKLGVYPRPRLNPPKPLNTLVALSLIGWTVPIQHPAVNTSESKVLVLENCSECDVTYKLFYIANIEPPSRHSSRGEILPENRFANHTTSAILQALIAFPGIFGDASSAFSTPCWSLNDQSQQPHAVSERCARYLWYW